MEVEVSINCLSFNRYRFVCLNSQIPQSYDTLISQIQMLSKHVLHHQVLPQISANFISTKRKAKKSHRKFKKPVSTTNLKPIST